MSHKRIFDDTELKKLYLNNKLSYVKLAAHFGASKNTIMKNIKALGIAITPRERRLGTTHSKNELEKMSLRRSAAWKAGKYKDVGPVISAAKKGKPNLKLRGRSDYKDRARQLGLKNIGRVSPFKGMRNRYGDATKAIMREKMIARLKAGVYSVKPTGPEKKVIAYVEQHNLPYKFVGDGKFWIESINPDFVNINGEKKAIDVHGCYWHHCPQCFPGDTGFKGKVLKDEKRHEIYKKYGWTVKTLWEHDVNKGLINL